VVLVVQRQGQGSEGRVAKSVGACSGFSELDGGRLSPHLACDVPHVTSRCRARVKSRCRARVKSRDFKDCVATRTGRGLRFEKQLGVFFRMGCGRRRLVCCAHERWVVWCVCAACAPDTGERSSSGGCCFGALCFTCASLGELLDRCKLLSLQVHQ